MSKPSLPSRPGQDVSKISASWLGKLLDCLTYAMEFPQGDNKTCRRNGDFMEVLRAPGGGQSAADTYNGEFSVLGETDEEGGNSISVVNGGDPTSGTCGTVQVGGEYLSVDTAVENVTGAGVVYLLIDYLPDDDGSVLEWTAEVKVAAAMPTGDYVDGAWVKTVKLADYTVEEGGGVTVTQSWTGGAIAVTDRVQ